MTELSRSLERLVESFNEVEWITIFFFVMRSDEQKAYFLPRILAGEVHFAIGYTEPGAGTDLAALRTFSRFLDAAHHAGSYRNREGM